MSKEVVKILSIDGGGVRGLIPALILDAISNELNNKSLINSFDLIAGTSTGALIAILLNTNKRTNLIVDLYENESKNIFNRDWHVIKQLNQLIKPKYNNEYLAKLLEKYLGKTTLNDCNKNMLIPAFDIKTMQPFFFKYRPTHYKHLTDSNFFLKDIALAATAAPTYFTSIPLESLNNNQSFCFVDGGLFANNPSLCAYIEAIKLYPNAKKYILVSLGTGEIIKSYENKNLSNWGVLDWVNPFKQVPIFSAFMYGQQGSVTHMTEKLPNTEIIRLNPSITGQNIEIDGSNYNSIKLMKDITSKYISTNTKLIKQVVELVK